jgi:hypothetical protein
MRDVFHEAFGRRFYSLSWPEGQPLPPEVGFLIPSKRLDLDRVMFGTGDQYQPGPQDLLPALVFHGRRDKSPRIRQFLVLPTGADRARRFLRALVNNAPKQVGNIVVLSGDSISFNQIYRDRRLSWNVLDLPLPLVLFSHRNPVDEYAGFHESPLPDRPSAATGTQDVLFYRDLLEAVVMAAHKDGRFVADADEFHRRLTGLRWAEEVCPDEEEGLPGGDGRDPLTQGRLTYSPGGRPLFDDKRNRHAGTGERVILLKPLTDGDINEAISTISVWCPADAAGPRRWHRDRTLRDVKYIFPG